MVNFAIHSVAMHAQKEREKRSTTEIQKEENGGKRDGEKQSTDEEVAQLTGWDSLPSEIQEDILLRVFSVYDLGRLKLVSKSLLNLISSHDFIYAHLARVPPKPLVSYVFTDCRESMKPGYSRSTLHRLVAFEIRKDGSTTTLHDRDLDLYTLLGLSKHDYIHVMCSCNGLLLLRASIYLHCKHEDVRLFVCNPVTRLSTKLPKLDYDSPHLRWWFAFGYDDHSRTYKVVGIQETLEDPAKPRKYEISICTLGGCPSGCSPWRVLDCKFYHNHVGNMMGIVTNRRLILVVKNTAASCLCSMDWNKEQLREISLPPTTRCPPTTVYEINGCLHCVYERLNKDYVEIWALRRSSNDGMMDCCWVKEHVVSTDSILTAIYQVPGPFKNDLGSFIRIVGSTSDGKKMMFHSLLHKKLVSYDMQSRQLMLIEFDEDGIGSKDNNSTSEHATRWIDRRFTHVSSLVSWL